jgi:acyl-coenzyme A synthetase/AMP-(fatty) acid ligase
MAKFKIPKYVRFIDRLSENAAGKIMRHLLKDIE